jgi:hypothetical protein
MVRIASYNVENLFARPKVFRTNDWSISEPILAAYEAVNALFQADTYSDQDKANIKRLLVELDISVVNASGAVRRKDTTSPRWAWLRKNRGRFDRQPEDTTKTSRSSPTGERVGSAGSNCPRKPSTRPAPG